MDNERLVILLIEDNPGDALLIRDALSREAETATFVLEWKDRLSSGLERLAEGGVDLILLDLYLPDSRSFDTFLRVRGQVPDIPIIVMSGLDDQSVAMRAVREGAQDYLIKGEANPATLIRAILYAVERNRAQIGRARQATPVKRGWIIGLIGAKGGAGTTTIAFNVATVLARADRSVILAEFRSDFGTLSVLTGDSPREDLGTLLDMSVEKINEADVRRRLVPAPYGPRILFGPQTPGVERAFSPAHAERILSLLSSMADYIVLDMPPSAGAANRAAVHQCHRVALLVEPEPMSVLAGKRVIAELRPSLANGAIQGAAVVNRTVQVSPMSSSEIEMHLGCELFASIQPAPNVFGAAQRAGTPIVIAHPRPAAALSLSELAKKLVSNQIAV